MTDHRIEHNGELNEMAALIASVPCEDRDPRLSLLRKVIQAHRRLIELSRQEILLKTLAELAEVMQNDPNHKLSELFKYLSNYAQAQARWAVCLLPTTANALTARGKTASTSVVNEKWKQQLDY